MIFLSDSFSGWISNSSRTITLLFSEEFLRFALQMGGLSGSIYLLVCPQQQVLRAVLKYFA